MAWLRKIWQAASLQTTAVASLGRAVWRLRDWQILAAELYATTGRVKDAQAAFERVLTRRPSHRGALAGLGRLLLRERHFEQAVEIWQRLVDLEPRQAGPSFQLARALHRSRRFEAAAAQYLRVVTLDPLHEKAFQALDQLTDRLMRRDESGQSAIDTASQIAQQLLALDSPPPRLRDLALTWMAIFRSRSDPQTELHHWQQLVKANPRAIEPRLQLAHHFARHRRTQEARDCYRAVLDLDPGHGEALLGYGQALASEEALRRFATWSTGNVQDETPQLELARPVAADADRQDVLYLELLQQMPQNRVALRQLAQVLSRNLTRIEPALDVWQRLAACDPGTAFPLVQRAQLLERVRRPLEAEVEYRAALERVPRDEAALFGLARLFLTQSRWSEALDLYTTLHEVKPRRTDVLLGLGRCLERLDRPEEALSAYEKVLLLDSRNTNGQLYRGRLLRQLGRTEDAIAAWREICRWTPGNPDAWYELVFMLASMEREEEALAALDTAEAALPATPASWTRLGLAAQAGQFHDRAVGFLERAIVAEPGDASHHARLGQHYLRRGILDGAFRHLLASRKLKPDDPGIARQLVETIHGLNVLGLDHLTFEATPARRSEVLVPEGLFHKVRELAETQIEPYRPVERRVIAVSSSLAGGGAERQLINVLRGLGAPAFGLELALFCISLNRRNRRDFFLPLLQGTPVEIVTPDESALEAYLADPAVAPHARLIRAFPADMVAPIAFWLGEFRRRRPQVIHAWQDATNLTAVVAGLLAGVPKIVLAARSVRPDNPRRRLKRFMREGYKAVLGHRSVLLSNNSRAGADDYADWLGLAPESIEVVYNGIDFDQLALQVESTRVRQVREMLGIPLNAFVVGSAFRMSEEKRPGLWVQTAAEMARRERNAHFIVYGDGPMRAEMVDLAHRLGIGDRLHLPGSEDDIASCYKAMDVVMLTSRHEGLPNVLLEAQSLGIPVVAPDVGGVGEALWHGVTGWAVRDADASRLAERLHFCLDDRAWRMRAERAAPDFVRKRFGIPAMLARTLEIYGLPTAKDG